MKKILSLAAGAALATAFVMTTSIPALSAADMFLKIEGIEGESTDSAHQGWVEVDSLNWGGPNRSRLSMMQTSEPRMGSPGSLVITKWTDRSSAHLLQYCSTGEHISKMIISDASGKKERYKTYELSDVTIPTCSTGGSGDVAMEEITFSYRKIQWGYDQAPKKKEDKWREPKE